MDCPYYEDDRVRWCNSKNPFYLPSAGEIGRYCMNRFFDCFHYAKRTHLAAARNPAGEEAGILQGG